MFAEWGHSGLWGPAITNGKEKSWLDNVTSVISGAISFPIMSGRPFEEHLCLFTLGRQIACDAWLEIHQHTG